MASKPKKKRRRCAGKGQEQERHICKRLSKWVSNCTREDCFWRAAMSGGRARVMSRKRTAPLPGRKLLNERRGRGHAVAAHAGDIVATHPLGEPLAAMFLIECKFYRELSLEGFIYGITGKVGKWWADLLQQCEQYNRQPMLVLRQNGRPEVVGTTRAGAAILRKGGELKAYAVFPQLGLRLYSFKDMVVDLEFDKVRAYYKEL